MAFLRWSTQACSLAGAWIPAAVLCALWAMVPAVAAAQSVNGSISVAATILPPIMTPAVKPLSFRIVRRGVARLETSPPFAGAVSAIVMSTVSSSANGFIPVPQPPVLVRAMQGSDLLQTTTGSTGSPASPWRYAVPLDSMAGRTEPHEVTVRITYLIVPGT